MTTRRRLLARYATLIIAVVAGVLVVSAAVGLYFSYRETNAQLVALQFEKAQGAATRIEQYVLDIEHQMSWTALPRVDSGGDASEQRRIEYLKLLRQAPAITEVAWIDSAGREQLRVSRLAMDSIGAGTDLANDPKFSGARGGKTRYGEVYFRKGTEPYMTISRPAGPGGGVTAAEVNLKFVWDVVSRIKIGTAGLAYVVDAGGTLIAHPDISLVLKKSDLSALPQVAARALPAAEAQPTARDLNGDEVLAAHVRIPTLDWTVFVESPRAEGYAPLYASLMRTGLLLLAGLLVATAASFYLAGTLVRPIRALQEGAAQIGAGELEHRIDVRTGDELEGLAEQFNKMGIDLKESYAGLERKVEARTAELSEALERQTATADILQVISSSPTDVRPVLEAVGKRAGLLCRAHWARVWIAEGGVLHAMATHLAVPELAPVIGKNLATPAGARTPARRAYELGQLVHIEDLAQVLDTEYPDAREAQHRSGSRSVLVVPMLREGACIGVIGLYRNEVRPFTAADIALVQTFADQAVIAIENVRLFNETKEALERQTATAEVLNVISQSMVDTQPVFDAIVHSCRRLFRGRSVILVLPEGALLKRAAIDSDGTLDTEGLWQWPLNRETASGDCVLSSKVIVVRDSADIAASYPRTAELALASHWVSGLFAPLLREGRAIGCIGILRPMAGDFDGKEVALAQTFADQAVIAIENVRLFNETKEALQRQTATAEILQVISSSVSDTQPVFDTILASCERLFGAQHMGINLVGADGLVHLAAHSGPTPDRAAFERTFPVPLTRESGSGSAILEGRVMHYPDTQAADVPPYVQRSSRANMTRSVIIAPLLWQGRGIGAIFVGRGAVGPFSDKDIALLRAFADQAVIAIQNARLFNETKDALEQQTATSEVLKTISRTTFDLQPVLTTLIESASRLCKADRGFVYLREGEMYQMKVGYPVEPGRIDPQALPAEPGSLVGRTALTREIVHIEDALSDPSYTWKEAQQRLGYRTMLGVPMLREGEPVGVVAMWRDEVRPFSERDMRVVTTFADQAVIALENVRLLSEIQAKSRELEAANRHKSEFLANMSHELRTPLNAIIGFSEVLAEQMFGEVNAKQLEYLQDIHSSGQHLLTLINDVLDLSKIEAGRMELELSCFDLGLLLDNSLTLVRERAQRHGLSVTLDVGEGLEEWVADARKVKQVVVNLLSNAVKFTPTGGRVSLRAQRVEVGDCVSAQISVADTGVGIAADEQALVFEEFRQASGDYLRKTEGTGLGLSLAKRFVELHGGTIRLGSRPGAGATFTVTLPLQSLEAIS